MQSVFIKGSLLRQILPFVLVAVVSDIVGLLKWFYKVFLILCIYVL